VGITTRQELKMTGFDHWLDTFVEEKGLDTEGFFEVEGPRWGTNFIPLGCVIEFCKSAPDIVQEKIKETLVIMDFTDDDVTVLFGVIAEEMAL
jgi:hypothetical protein